LPDPGTAAARAERVLLHICCGPCAVFPVEALRQEGFSVEGFWYNPNIHPLAEYRQRLESCRRMALLMRLSLHEDDVYGLQSYLEATFPSHTRRPERCAICYRLRLGRAAEAARESGLPYYTTTLLVSPYQNSELLATIGVEEGRRHGVEFLSRDFKQGFRAGRQKSREMGLYHQRYCGCIFSEAESQAGPGGRR